MKATPYVNVEVNYKSAYHDLYQRVALLLTQHGDAGKTNLLIRWDKLREDFPLPIHSLDPLESALRRISHSPHGKVFCADGHEEAVLIARSALQQKESE